MLPTQCIMHTAGHKNTRPRPIEAALSQYILVANYTASFYPRSQARGRAISHELARLQRRALERRIR